MELKHKVFNLIILDESGSMGTIKDSIINGFNELVQTVKGIALQFPEQEHFISLVTFNALRTNTLIENGPVEKLDLIDAEKYQPDAGTPLYDAIGRSIAQLKRVTNTHSNYNVLVTILTDGEENASKEYTGRAIEKIISDLKLQNWTFTYIGANHDVKNFAASLSISNTMVFEPNVENIKKIFGKERNARLFFSEKLRNKENLTDDYYSEKPDDKI